MPHGPCRSGLRRIALRPSESRSGDAAGERPAVQLQHCSGRPQRRTRKRRIRGARRRPVSRLDQSGRAIPRPKRGAERQFRCLSALNRVAEGASQSRRIDSGHSEPRGIHGAQTVRWQVDARRRGPDVEFVDTEYRFAGDLRPRQHARPFRVFRGLAVRTTRERRIAWVRLRTLAAGGRPRAHRDRDFAKRSRQ
jgi:hypothetical protein